MTEAIMEALISQTIELRGVDIGHHVDRVHISALQPVDFAMQYVARNKPVIITGALDDWPAMQRFNAEYLTAAAGDTLVTVDLTPHGNADSVTLVRPSPTCGPRTAHVVTPIKDTHFSPVAQPDEHQQASHSRKLLDANGNSKHTAQSVDSASVQHTCATGCEESCQSPGGGAGVGEDDGDGSGAALQQWFTTPCEVKMTVGEFFELFRQSRDSSGSTRIVPYIQHQNSSFTEEWAFLSEDTQPHLDWADKVFGGPPAATNLWVGDERSVTSVHKDAYENLYAVVRGTKVFHLLPPSDCYRLNIRRHPTGTIKLIDPPSKDQVNTTLTHTNISSQTRPAHHLQHSPKTLKFTVLTQGTGDDSEGVGSEGLLTRQVILGQSQLVAELNHPSSEVLWSDVDLSKQSQGTTQTDMRGKQQGVADDPRLPAPLVAEVGPGEVLFLPALWYHRVSQVCSQKDHDYVIAVNFWYDMAFDHRWSQFQLVESLARLAGLADDPPTI